MIDVPTSSIPHSQVMQMDEEAYLRGASSSLQREREREREDTAVVEGEKPRREREGERGGRGRSRERGGIRRGREREGGEGKETDSLSPLSIQSS